MYLQVYLCSQNVILFLSDPIGGSDLEEAILSLFLSLLLWPLGPTANTVKLFTSDASQTHITIHIPKAHDTYYPLTPPWWQWQIQRHTQRQRQRQTRGRTVPRRWLPTYISISLLCNINYLDGILVNVVNLVNLVMGLLSILPLPLSLRVSLYLSLSSWGRHWIVRVMSFRNMYGYMGLWSTYVELQDQWSGPYFFS